MSSDISQLSLCRLVLAYQRPSSISFCWRDIQIMQLHDIADNAIMQCAIIADQIRSNQRHAVWYVEFSFTIPNVIHSHALCNKPREVSYQFWMLAAILFPIGSHREITVTINNEQFD